MTSRSTSKSRSSVSKSGSAVGMRGGRLLSDKVCQERLQLRAITLTNHGTAQPRPQWHSGRAASNSDEMQSNGRISCHINIKTPDGRAHLAPSHHAALAALTTRQTDRQMRLSTVHRILVHTQVAANIIPPVHCRPFTAQPWTNINQQARWAHSMGP